MSAQINQLVKEELNKHITEIIDRLVKEITERLESMQLLKVAEEVPKKTIKLMFDVSSGTEHTDIEPKHLPEEVHFNSDVFEIDLKVIEYLNENYLEGLKKHINTTPNMVTLRTLKEWLDATTEYFNHDIITKIYNETVHDNLYVIDMIVNNAINSYTSEIVYENLIDEFEVLYPGNTNETKLLKTQIEEFNELNKQPSTPMIRKKIGNIYRTIRENVLEMLDSQVDLFY